MSHQRHRRVACTRWRRLELPGRVGVHVVALVHRPIADGRDRQPIGGEFEPKGVVVDVRIAVEAGVPQRGGLGLKIVPYEVLDAEAVARLPG
jgi:hypothetical protein